MDGLDAGHDTESASTWVMTFCVSEHHPSKDGPTGSIGRKLSLVVTEGGVRRKICLGGSKKCLRSCN